MRILYFTAGFGRAVGGGAQRDTELVAELQRLGHEVTLTSLFGLPAIDRASAVAPRVCFGRASVYLQQRVPALRWTPPVFDRVWDHPSVLRALDHHPFGIDHRTFREIIVSVLRGRQGYQQKEFDKLVDAFMPLARPDVICIASSYFTSLAQPLKDAFGRPVVSLLDGLDTMLELWPAKPRYEALELLRRQVGSVDAFLAASRWHATLMKDWLAIPPARIHIVPPGIAMDDLPVPFPRSRKWRRIGFLGRIAPEKGLHVLADAYLHLRGRGRLPSASLEVAGDLEPEHTEYLEQIRRRFADVGLSDELAYHGRLDRREKLEFLANLDALSVPSTFAPADSRVVVESLASATPVVLPSRGVFAELLDSSGGGIPVAPDDAIALADGLLALLEHPGRRDEASRRGRAFARGERTIGQHAARFVEVCQVALDAEAPAHAQSA